MRAPLLALSLACTLLGCGARTGLSEGLDAEAAPRDADTPSDAPGLDGSLDAALDATVVELACDGRPLPRPGAGVVGIADVRFPRGLGVLLPEPEGILVFSGQGADGAPIEAMAFLDLGRRAAGSVELFGDAVPLPQRDGVAVYVPSGDRVIVVGGTAGGVVTDAAIELIGGGDPTGRRFVVRRALAPYPPGSVAGLVGVHDPVADRVIVAGASTGTWALELADERWVELAAPAESPAYTYAMGYEPGAHRAIVVATGRGGDEPSVEALPLTRGMERWARLDAIDFVPSVRGELHYDPRACGFHLLSARRTRCVLEHWVLAIEGDRARTIRRGELSLEPAHFLAMATFVPSRDEIVLYAAEDCRDVGAPGSVAHVVPLTR